MKSDNHHVEEEQKDHGTVSYRTYFNFYFGGKAKIFSTISISFLVVMVVRHLSLIFASVSLTFQNYFLT